MEKRIILTSLLVALIFSSFIIYSSFAQTLPICVAPQQYLYWQPGQHAAGYVPFASTSINFLMRSPIYVSSTNVGIGTNNPQAKLHVAGGILSNGNYAFKTGSDIWRGTLYGYGTSSNTLFSLIQQGIRVDLYSTSWQWLSRGDIYVRNVSASNNVTANQFCIGNNCITQWPSQLAQYWTLSGNNLYTSSTNWNVGIGTTIPSVYKLYIYNTNPNLYGSLGATIIVDSPAFVYGVVGSSHNTNVNGPAIGIYGWASSSNASYGVYGVGYGPSGIGVRAYGQRYNIFAANPNALNIFYGNVGIGTTDPLGYKLRVEGGNVLIGNGNSDPSIMFKGRSGDNHAAIRWLTNDLTTQKVVLGVYGDNAWFYPVGNVGIGTNNPQAKLEVAGAIRLAPTSQPSNATTGMMYFDQSSGVFKCFQKKGVDRNNNPIYDWVDCGGQGGRPSEGLVIPVVIKDSAGNVVLEINQE